MIAEVSLVLAQSDSIGGYIALATAVLYMLAQLGGVFGKREPSESKLPGEGGSDVVVETEKPREASPPPPPPKARPSKPKPPRARPADTHPKPVPVPRRGDASPQPVPSRRQEDFSPVPRPRPAVPPPMPALEPRPVEITAAEPLETISAALRRGLVDKPMTPPALRPSGLLGGLRTREGLRAAIAMSEVLGRPVSERRDHLDPP